MRFLPTIALAFLTALTIQAADVSRQAKPLEIKTLDGKTVSLEQFHGKVVAVFFFSTDCPHCQNTVGVLNPMYTELKSKGLEIMGLAVNPSAAGNLRDFQQKFSPLFPIGLTTRSDWSRFGGHSITVNPYVPYLIMVDRKGMIREVHPGEDRAFWLEQEKNLRQSFESLLNEPVKKSPAS